MVQCVRCLSWQHAACYGRATASVWCKAAVEALAVEARCLTPRLSPPGAILQLLATADLWCLRVSGSAEDRCTILLMNLDINRHLHDLRALV